MMFLGNPGTGKTSIARLVAGVLRDVGRLPRGQLHEVQRSDLVAGYVGQTAQKTKTEIEKAMGGVLFVDEAYRLAPKEGGKDFGMEAIDELMAVMNDGDPIMIFAGYVKEMEEFTNSNAGFARRVQRVFHFADYTERQLAQIAMIMIKKKGKLANIYIIIYYLWERFLSSYHFPPCSTAHTSLRHFSQGSSWTSAPMPNRGTRP